MITASTLCPSCNPKMSFVVVPDVSSRSTTDVVKWNVSGRRLLTHNGKSSTSLKSKQSPVDPSLSICFLALRMMNWYCRSAFLRFRSIYPSSSSRSLLFCTRNFNTASLSNADSCNPSSSTPPSSTSHFPPLRRRRFIFSVGLLRGLNFTPNSFRGVLFSVVAFSLSLRDDESSLELLLFVDKESILKEPVVGFRGSIFVL